ncbi:hypothetical protein NKH77_15515 [Streptomyces sp. M19]
MPDTPASPRATATRRNSPSPPPRTWRTGWALRRSYGPGRRPARLRPGFTLVALCAAVGLALTAALAATLLRTARTPD